MIILNEDKCIVKYKGIYIQKPLLEAVRCIRKNIAIL